MGKTTIILFISLCLNINIQAQGYFNKIYDTPFSPPVSLASGIIEVAGGYVCLGQAITYTERQILLFKLNYSGDTIWQSHYKNGANIFFSNAILETENGYIVAGNYRDSVGSENSDISLAWFDAVGNFDSLKSYGGNKSETYGGGFARTADGGYILTGKTQSFGAGSSDFYLLKTDSMGNKQWDKTYGGTNIDGATSVAMTSDGGYILSGYTYIPPSGSITGHYDSMVLKTDSLGNEEWQKKFGTPYDDAGGIIIELMDGYFLLSTAFRNSVGDLIAQILKLDYTGKIYWQKQFPSGSYSALNNTPIENNDGTLILGGIAKNSLSKNIYRLLKLDPLGNIIWSRSYFTDPNLSQYIYDLKPTSDDGYIFCGSAFDSTSIQKAWVVKTDCFGCDSLLCYYGDSVCYFYECNDYPIDAFFTASADTIDLAFENSISFTNPFGNTTARHWDFGDGEKAYTDSIITHEFKEEGTYTVSLKVHHAACNDVFSKEVVVVNSTGVDGFRISDLKFRILPNPASNYVSIQISNQNKLPKPYNLQVRIFDLYGKTVLIKPLSTSHTQIDLSEVPAGIYYCVLSKENEILGREKIVVVK